MSLPARVYRGALRQSVRRYFTEPGPPTPRAHGVTKRPGLAVFEPSSSPELDEVLDTIRKRILLPEYLNNAQQKLVYQKRARPQLEGGEPFITTVGGQDVELEHLDRHKDIPRRWTLYQAALNTARTQADWDNVARLLEGFKGARLKLADDWMEQFVRVASNNGMQHVVLQCLQRVEHTGLSLASPKVTRAVMWRVVRQMAAAADWEEKAVERAYRYAVQIVDMLDSPLHGHRRVVSMGDLRTLPFVIAGPLELAAVNAVLHKDGADVDDRVHMYAGRLMNNLKQYGTQQTDTPAADSSGAKPRFQLLESSIVTMTSLIPVWHGLSLAQKVLKEKMPMMAAAQSAVAELEAQIEAAADVVKANVRAGFDPDTHWAIVSWRKCIR